MKQASIIVDEKQLRYIEAAGGRKTARARARIFEHGTGVTVNNQSVSDYFCTVRNRTVALASLELVGMTEKLGVSVRVTGGGSNAQADAVRNGIARALVRLNADFKKPLRSAGYLTRDARMVERKKYGLKKARRAPQWKKR
jgi:small subunit ribosomal protein S9